ncbi:hypothetical protein M501DRAFT_999990 [Patellaria atrata CBS 101060]|uniref:Uncharacterized protein n=1 Tax=Patellaria atrata CBS 101060 TaxID=1346257 RepID=A0A9P4S1U1_9PEZI|nr:hypothetical protein M501DRAFT_999990 [Patellaria atrata CBS 101060]
MFDLSLKKRRREVDEDEEAAPATAVQGNHGKRIRSNVTTEEQPTGQSYMDAIPFRPSEHSPHPFWRPTTITPAESEESAGESPVTQPDSDMEMDEGNDIFGPLPSPDTPAFATPLRPARLHWQAMQQFPGGRIPTPIHSNFYTNNNTFLKMTSRSNSDVSQMELEHLVSGSQQTSRILPGLDRRLPSPVSEDEMDTQTSIAGSQLSHLSVVDEEFMEVDRNETMLSEPPKRGRARSGAIATEKKKFSMGYREDCPKCQARVPGHYSHFLPA